MSSGVPLLVPDRLLHRPGIVGVPCGEQGRWTEFTRSLIVLERPAETRISFVYGAYIQANRDELVKQMLDTGAAWLFMVDDDHTFDRKLLINLLDRRVPVVGALALPRKPPYFVCAFSETNRVTGVSRGLSLKDLRFEMQEVAAVGTGAILIRREVLEALEPPWFATGSDENGINVGEDIIFCERAREAGFGVWLDATQSLGHLTGVTISLDPRGVVFDLGNEESIVIPTEQIEEVEPDPAPAPTLELKVIHDSVELPIVSGPSGLTGRVPIHRPQDDPIEPVGEDEHGSPVFAETPADGPSLPPACLRRLSMPDRGDGRNQCDAYCAGRQRDGSCLTDIVRLAQAAGIEPSFELDSDGYWIYNAAPSSAATPPE